MRDHDYTPPAPTPTHPVTHVQDRIDRLLDVAERWDRPGGSRALARRARDKADGLAIALRILEPHLGYDRD